jgi:oligoendopeptidase F
LEKTIEKRLTRSEVPTEMTWDLGDLFLSRSDWENELKNFEASFHSVTTFKGTICDNKENLLKCLIAYENLYKRMIRLATYVSLRQSEDGTNPSNQADSILFSSVATQFSKELSFIDSELVLIDEDTLLSYVQNDSNFHPFKSYIQDIIRSKSHKLSPETEEALAAIGEVTSAPYQIYQMSKAADLTFKPFLNEEEVELPNSFALFETKYEFSSNPTIRKNAYESFVATLSQYKNTYASVYATEVKKQVALSKLRNYESVTHMLLHSQKVTIEMYHNQLDVIFNEFAPHMRRYARLKQKELGLETLHFYDLKAPLDVDFQPETTYEKVQEIILDALKVLGPEYSAIMEKAYNERWIDYSDNVGKRTGAFCSSPYGVHPYILISFQDTMRSAFTMAHELGHAGHFYLANGHQSIFNTRPSLYFIEAPSTLNERLLAQYLLKNTDDNRMKRWVILQSLGTYYHNFVTHLLEAEFQRRIYDLAEKGTSLTANVLCDTKGAILKEFWGDTVEIDEGASLTWMRQPHYYMGLYPYTYSAGLTASTAIAQKIEKEGQPVVDKWINVLKAGGTMSPNELLNQMGIDMSTPEPIRQAVQYVGSLIDDLEKSFS